MNILLTGGGSAGHVIPNIAIAEALRTLDKKVRLSYIGSAQGLERRLCEEAKIPFEAIHTGKLRRYFSLLTLLDIFRVPLGTVEAFFKLLRLKPTLVFSKGGFVGFPVVFAAWVLRIPVFIHESDAIPGLATKLSVPFARKVFLGYAEAAQFLKKNKKIEVMGNPVRAGLSEGSVKKALQWTGFDGRHPVLLVMGGSGGSAQINERVQREKENLLAHYDIIHLTGEGKGKNTKQKHYIATSFVDENLQDLYALASLALTRAGASALTELEALQIPALLFPLGLNASRGDQWANAQALCKKSNLYRIIDTEKPLTEQLLTLPKRPKKTVTNNAAEKIAKVLLSNSHA